MKDIAVEDIHPQDRQIATQPGAVFRMRSGEGYRFVQSASPVTGLADVDALVRERDAAIEQMVAAQQKTNAYLQVYRAVLATSLDGFLLGEVLRNDEGAPFDLKVLAVNEAFHSQTGIPAEAVRGRTLADAGVPADPAWRQIWERILDGGRVVSPMRTAGGRHLDVAVFGVDGDVIGAHIRDVTAQREAQLQVASSLEQFRLIAEFATDLAFQSDPDGRISWISHSCHQILGRAPDEMIGEFGAQFVHPDDRLKSRNAVENGGSCEIRILHTDGSYRWMRFGVHMLENPTDGSPIRIGSALDIDAEHRMLGEVESGKAHMAATLGTLMDPYLVLEAVRDDDGIEDFVFNECNDAAAKEIGLDRSELSGRRLLDLFPSLRHNQFPLYRATVESGQPLVLDEVVLELGEQDATPGTHRFDLRVTKCEDGVALTWRDVTERYSATSKLRRSEELARSALQSAPFGTALLSVSGRIESVNPALCQLLGRDDDWLIGRKLEALLGPGGPESLSRAVAVLQPGGSTTTEQHLITSYGTLVPVRITVSALTPSGDAPRLVCHFIATTSEEAGKGTRAGQQTQRSAASRSN